MIIPILCMSGPTSQTHFGGITWQLSCFDELDHLFELSALVIDFILAQRDEYLARLLNAQPEAEPFEAARHWHYAAFLRV